MFKSFFSVGGLTALSRLTGFAREVMIGALMGAGPIADAYFVALRPIRGCWSRTATPPRHFSRAEF
jgi:peptidoglycan biosynthesis protein MviN/MurJ (putative lipid II flippase)